MREPREEETNLREGLTETRHIAPAEEAGEVIGPYHLLQKIGEGGMGEVWLAEQKEPVRRRVALKLIKAGMDTREVVARFQIERQALALMDHPSIAKVFDAGATAQGRPFFVMEYVGGIPITDFCDKHRMTTEARLELFTRVCEGVQHAHQKAIIHRDLKPSNILVSEVDGKPLPRIIDFGIAKATAQRLTAGTMFTHMGVVVGTPGYMSPEQADSAGEDVDTRTDVYALGVVLYELLVGALPLDFRKAAFDEVLRMLRDQDAPKPSTKLKTSPTTSTAAAKNRGTDVPTLMRLLRGDLDAISLKALEKDRARRYGSPADLAADIGRYLRREPIAARPSSAVYRTRMYVRRHRVGVAVGSFVVLLLIASGAAQTLTLRRVMHERDRADRITDFMTRLFQVQNPSEARGNQITARQVLDKGSASIASGLASDPELRAQLMQVMGRVYRNLGIYSRAESLLKQSEAILRDRSGGGAAATLSAVSDLADVLKREGHYVEAEKLSSQALLGEKKVLGDENRQTLDTMSILASAYFAQGREVEAETLMRQVVQSDKKQFGAEDEATASAVNQLAFIVRARGQWKEARDMFRESVEIDRKAFGPDDPKTLNAITNLATALDDAGNFADAEKMEREGIAVRSRVLGAEHPDTLWATTNMAGTLNNEGKFQEVAAMLPAVIEAQRRVVGAEHISTVQSLTYLGGALTGLGEYPAAEKVLQEALDSQRKAHGPGDGDTAWIMGYLALAIAHQHRAGEADAMIRQAYDIQVKAFGADSPVTADIVYHRAAIASVESRKEEAISLLEEALDHGMARAEMVQVGNDPEFQPLHGEAKFKDLLADIRKRIT